MNDILDTLRQRQLVLRQASGVSSLPYAPPRPDELRTYLAPAPPAVAEYVCPLPPGSGPLAQLKATRELVQDVFDGADPSHYNEFGRILRLPVEPPMTQAEAEEFSRARVLAQAYASGFRLFPVQAQAVRDFERLDGLFAPIGVGWGKTLVTLMIAESAYRRNSRRSLLLIPSQVYDQLTRRDIGWARGKVPLSVPFIYLGRTSADNRMMRAKAARHGCYVMPYSILSTKTGEELLNVISPDLLILDEAHLVKTSDSARTKRLMRMIREHHPKLCVLSGTITSKSLMEYHHLMVHSLGERSPIPIPTSMANDWAGVIDSQGGMGNEKALRPLVDWARRTFPSSTFAWDRSGFRSAYRLRLSSAPGVVATSDAELGISLVLANNPAVEGGNHGFLEYEDMDHIEGLADVARLMRQVEDEFLTPDKDEIEYAIHTFKWLYELSAGFYYSLRWPDIEDLARKRNIHTSQAKELLDRAIEHHSYRQSYHRTLREWLKENQIAGLDSPMLVGSSMTNYGAKYVGHELYDSWLTMKEHAFEGMPERISVPVRVSDYKIRAAVRWAESIRGGALIWYKHQHIGEWLHEALLAAGVDVLFCPAGANEAITDPKNENKKIVASIKAHGTGKNLQAFQNTYMVQFPREAKDLEQVLGRNHRQGQTADELIVATCHTLKYDYMILSAALNDALYIQQSTGQRQKAIYAAYDPLPSIFPYEVLAERGFRPRFLDVSSRKEFEERFSRNER